MKYVEIEVGGRYVYRAAQGPGYSRYDGATVEVVRKSDKKIRVVTIQFQDGPRRGQTRVVGADELYSEVAA